MSVLEDNMILEEQALNDLKWDFNYNLGRYVKGCEYCSNNPKEADRWIPTLLELKKNIEILLSEIEKCIEVTPEEVLRGFEINETTD